MGKTHQTNNDNSNNSDPHFSDPHFLYGRHPIEEAVQQNYRFKKIWIQKNLEKNTSADPLIDRFIDYCRQHHIQFRFVEKSELDKKSRYRNHQGVIAEIKQSHHSISNLDPFLSQLDPTLPQLILITDQITDTQNFGAITRTAYYFGCCLIVTENHHSSPINATVHKSSAGASLRIPFYSCDKLSQAIGKLQQNGYLVIAATSHPSTHSSEFPYFIKEWTPETLSELHPQSPPKIAVILGSEDRGIRPHLQRLTDANLSIKAVNSFDSLNVSVAAGIILNHFKEII